MCKEIHADTNDLISQLSKKFFVGAKEFLVEGMRLTPKEHLDRRTKTSVYLIKKLGNIDNVRFNSQMNAIWLTPLTHKELYSDIKAAMPHIDINSYEIDLGQTPMYELLDTLMIS